MKWWGYLHVQGRIQVKRFWDCYLPIDDAISSPFVAQVIFPFHADSRDEAIEYCKNFLIWIEKNKYRVEKTC